MHNKSSKFLLSSLILALTACGGSSGNDHNNTTKPSLETTTSTTNDNHSSSTHNTPPATTNNGGKNTPSATNDNWFKPAQTPSLTYDKFKVKPVANNLVGQIQKVVENTNRLRAEKGLAPLKYDEKLSAYAQRRAEQIVGRFSHTLPDSNLPTTSEVNAGENIAAGADNADETVLVQWRNSKGHYDNLMTKHYQTIGVGLVYVPGSELTYYWVQLFGTNDTVSPYYFDPSPAAKQNPLADATAKSQQALPATQWLRIDGTDIPLHHVSGNGQWHNISQGGYQGIVNGYNDTRFGVVKNGSEAYKAFYHGNNTAYENMPQSGSATYTGIAVISDGNTVNTHVEAHMKADFSTKQLNGALVENNVKLMGIQANIRGSSFYSPEGSPVSTQGSFFGTHADEIGGVFYETSTSKRGAFAAKK